MLGEITMIQFLYMGGFLSIFLLGTLTFWTSKKIAKKKLSDKESFYLFTKGTLRNLIIAALVLLLFINAVPFLLWHLGEKEMGIAEKITDRKNIYPISADQHYVLETFEEAGSFYSFNIYRKKSEISDKMSTEGVEIDYINQFETPRVETIARYKIKMLKKKSFLNNAVNDIYANVYTTNSKLNYVDKISRICIPKNSLLKDKEKP
jgi:hypothetical protein